MIEMFYSAHILDAADDLARRALVPMVSAPRRRSQSSRERRRFKLHICEERHERSLRKLPRASILVSGRTPWGRVPRPGYSRGNGSTQRRRARAPLGKPAGNLNRNRRPLLKRALDALLTASAFARFGQWALSLDPNPHKIRTPPPAHPARGATAKDPQASSIPWPDKPFQTVDHASAILCGSRSRTYGLLADGELEAVRLAGKIWLKRPRSSLSSKGMRRSGSPTTSASRKPWRRGPTWRKRAKAAAP